MAEYKNETLGVSFSVPDSLTVRQQLAYLGAAGTRADGGTLVQLWEAARSIILDWQCDGVPLDVSLDTACDFRVTRVIVWAGGKVAEHIAALGRADPNGSGRQ